MKVLLFISVLLLLSPAWAQAPCHVSALPTVVVPPLALSLADILSPDTCSEMLHAAARVRFGRAPLPGSARVLDGDQVQALVQHVQQNEMPLQRRTLILHLPPRITLRRAGALASCADIRTRLDSRPAGISNTSRLAPVPAVFGCGAADRIANTAPLEIVRRVWDPASESWSVLVRCVRPQACVPFLVHGLELSTMIQSSSRASLPEMPRILVKPGQRATLIWIQDGIRLEIPAMCLDAGREGETIRARLARTSRIIRAVVLTSGELRAVS